MAKITTSFDYPDADEMFLRVALKVSKQSLRNYVGECVRGNQQRMRNIYRDRIEVKARELGLSWEHCFNLYLNFEEPFTDDMIEKAKSLRVLLTKDFAVSNLGNEEKPK